MLTEEQKLERLSFVTGSDAGIICNQSPFCTPYELWLQKTRREIAKDISDNPTVKAGNKLESSVRQWFEDETNMEVELSDRLLVHKEHSWMGANIDGKIKGEKAILEIKTSTSDKGWGQQGTDKIPDHYLLQVAHYMAVTDSDYAYVAVLIRGFDFRYYKIMRDLKLEKALIENEYNFWHENVLKDIAPEPTTANDVILSLQGRALKEELTADVDAQPLLDEYAYLKLLHNKQKQMLEELEERICMYMGEYKYLYDINGKLFATWNKVKGRRTLDAKKIKENHPDLYNEYVKIGKAGRRFNFKGSTNNEL